MEGTMQQQTARILVVDDEAAIRLTMEILLRRHGYTVTTAASGEEALTLIEQQPFDVLLLDLKMPGLSGLEVAERAQKLQPATPILILTGSSAIEGALEEPGIGRFSYVIKTASPEVVLERVAAALRYPSVSGRG
jgi:DNA-binding NtrC family response regulator